MRDLSQAFQYYSSPQAWTAHRLTRVFADFAERTRQPDLSVEALCRQIERDEGFHPDPGPLKAFLNGTSNPNYEIREVYGRFFSRWRYENLTATRRTRPMRQNIEEFLEPDAASFWAAVRAARGVPRAHGADEPAVRLLHGQGRRGPEATVLALEWAANTPFS